MATELDSAIATVAASCQRITDAMMAKGLERPEVYYMITPDGVEFISAKYHIGHDVKSINTPWNDKGSEAYILDKIAKMPDAAGRARNEFLRLAAVAADFAAKNLPDADPHIEAIRAGITATMQRLAKNAIECEFDV